MPEEVIERVVSGSRKAAIVLLAIGQDTAAKVIQCMERSQIEEITRIIAELEGIQPDEQEVVLSEFYNLALARRYCEQGGMNYAQSLLEKGLSSEEASEIIRQVSQTIQQTPFQFLQKTEAENILTFIQDEHPQTNARRTQSRACRPKD